MAPYKPWHVNVTAHPGSSIEEIATEPDWGSGHQHRVGYKNKSNRIPGITHENDQGEPYVKRAHQKRENLLADSKAGRLINFRDAIGAQEDFHLRHPENRSLGWRYVLETTEEHIKHDEAWPVNKKKGNNAKASVEKRSTDQQEHEQGRAADQGKHNPQYATRKDSSDHKNDVSNKYTAQELALLKALEYEKSHVSQFKEDQGKRKSPQTKNRVELSIDEQDQFTPDNWIPRSPDLIRNTGKHPLNAEPNLTTLFNAGLVTPNELHYVRNHGAVPRILWEFHRIDVEHNGNVAKSFTMDDIQTLDTINIPVALACDGNRRKELNMIRKSKGFGWGAGAISCSYWKGPLVRDVVLAAGIASTIPTEQGQRWWLNFEGSDEPSDGKYSTCIPFEYAMNPSNDVILAYEMNDLPLPPDHGYPVRLLIPGYVGGRCVKWVRRIWTSDRENDSHYHIWDNRVLPAFVTEKDGPFAETLFRHPDTACNEQNLNSVIARPAHGEKIALSSVKQGSSYRIQGLAYDGGGHQIQRVEVSLDGGETWLYCVRKFTEYPVRHGNKFWAWIHWHVDVEISHLIRAESIMVRCFNVFKNTQPRDHNWNLTGMMNNCCYRVQAELTDKAESDSPAVTFRHPTDPNDDTGWMKPSAENRIAQVLQEAGTPQKEFTRAEIEKHDKAEDCWLVVNGNVYDATSVLDWHPGGSAAILSHAGKVHQETSDEFDSIHDDYGYQKLKECILGKVTEKAANFIKAQAEAAAKNKARPQSGSGSRTIALQKHRWTPVKLTDKKWLSKDTRTYTFQLPGDKPSLGLGTCQHVLVGFHFIDRMLVRSYTPTRPLLPAQDHAGNGRDPSKAANSGAQNLEREVQLFEDGQGSFDLTVKTYFPDDKQPGGAMSNILDCVPIGEEVEIRGPTGEIVYNGNGDFVIEGKERHFNQVSLVLGGSGITPGYSLIARILMSKGDKTMIKVVDANRTESDILLTEELKRFEDQSAGQLSVTHVLSHADEDWKGLKGHVNREILTQYLFQPAKGSVVFLCGPPAMIQNAAVPALEVWGYIHEENMFGF